MESRIHGDMYVRFGGRLVETYYRKVEKRCWPSLLKEIADFCGIKKNLTTHVARHTFGTTVTLANNVPLQPERGDEQCEGTSGMVNIQPARHSVRTTVTIRIVPVRLVKK